MPIRVIDKRRERVYALLCERRIVRPSISTYPEERRLAPLGRVYRTTQPLSPPHLCTRVNGADYIIYLTAHGSCVNGDKPQRNHERLAIPLLIKQCECARLVYALREEAHEIDTCRECHRLIGNADV